MDLKSRLDVGEMRWLDKYKPTDRSRAGKDAFYENLLVAVVLIFSFIYFLFQLYTWFIGLKGS